jgi:hypothetical protein
MAAAPAFESPILRLPMLNGGRATFHENHLVGLKQLAESIAGGGREFADLQRPKRKPYPSLSLFEA